MSVLAGLPFDVPVTPDAPTASDWLIQELAKPAYQAAKPTLFDRIAKAIGDWLNSLDLTGAKGPPVLGIGLVIALIVIGLVVAFLIFGVPRLNRRSAIAGALFGEEDHRTAARMREDAEAAAARGDFSVAVVEMFRAIARGLAERTIVTTSPGTTARDCAARAALSFPELATRLVESAAAFDEVRYLGRTGTIEQYRHCAALETDLRATRPTLETTDLETVGA